MPIPDGLLEAYRRTRYCADLPDGEVVLRIGECSAELDGLLAARGAHAWAFVTADNPGSVIDASTMEASTIDAPTIDPVGNAARRARLLAHVQGLGLAWFTGRATADAGDWPAEESLLVLGLDLNEARDLGRRFGQLAVVAGVQGGPARLVACDF